MENKNYISHLCIDVANAKEMRDFAAKKLFDYVEKLKNSDDLGVPKLAEDYAKDLVETSMKYEQLHFYAHQMIAVIGDEEDKADWEKIVGEKF